MVLWNHAYGADATVVALCVSFCGNYPNFQVNFLLLYCPCKMLFLNGNESAVLQNLKILRIDCGNCASFQVVCRFVAAEDKKKG